MNYPMRMKYVQNAVIIKPVIVSFAEICAKLSVDLQKHKFYAKIYRVFVELYSDGSGYLMGAPVKYRITIRRIKKCLILIMKKQLNPMLT